MTTPFAARVRNHLMFLAFGLIAGCGNLTCDQNRQQSIKHMNAGIEAATTASYASAEKELQLASTLDPENHAAAYHLGQVYVTQKKWDKAVEALSVAVKHNDGDAMYHYHLGHAYLELDTPNPSMAQAELEKAVKLNDRLYKAHYFLGRTYLLQEKPKEAAAAFTRSAQLNPQFGKPYIELGNLYFQWDHFPQAVQVLSEGAKHARDAEDRTNIFHALGMAYVALKQHDKAVEAFEKALEERKDNLDARFQLGMAYAELGKKAEARKYLEEYTKQGGGTGNVFFVQAANDRLLKLTGE